jgi:hypothetical protein
MALVIRAVRPRRHLRPPRGQAVLTASVPALLTAAVAGPDYPPELAT